MLLKSWNECLKESLDAETRSKTIGFEAQMKTFNFFFGFYLGQGHYSLTDNLSKILQKEKISTVSGQGQASLTAKIIQSIRNDLFYETFSKKAEEKMMI